MKLKVGIPYGRETVNVHIEERNIGEIVFPNEVKIGNEEQIIGHALANPISSDKFDEFLSDAKDILFLVISIAEWISYWQYLTIRFYQFRL